MLRHGVFGLAVGMALLSLCSARLVEVTTEYGPVIGIDETGPNVTAFYGIPFASPPVGQLRFRSPQPPTPWTKPKDCTVDKILKSCPQFHITKHILYGEEDCLYLNIAVPGDIKPGEKLPVMFWIYGGGYVLGDGDEFGSYDPKHLAERRRVVVVTHNYRLNSFGFFAADALRDEDPDNSTGNYGLLDQQRALEFTYRNIDKFGGDPSSITIYGESAGAFSVCWHVVSPVSRPYFKAAIMESGTCDSAEFFVDYNRSLHFSQVFAKGVGCGHVTGSAQIDCLRKIAYGDLFFKLGWPYDDPPTPPLAPLMPWGPTVDGVALRGNPLSLIRKGQWAKVPMIMGTNKDEGTIFVLGLPLVIPGTVWPAREKDIDPALAHFFNASAISTIKQLYNRQQYPTPDEMLAQLLRDFFFLCSTRRSALVMAEQGVPVHIYHFRLAMKNWVGWQALGNYHTSELPLVFDNQEGYTFNHDERVTSDAFTLYWTNMARYGNPNGNLEDKLFWPAFNASSELTMAMDVPQTLIANLMTDACHIWDSIKPIYDTW